MDWGDGQRRGGRWRPGPTAPVTRTRCSGCGSGSCATGRGPRRRSTPTPPFPDGWRAAAIEGGVQPALLDSLDEAGRSSFEALAADRRQLASHLRERDAADPDGTQAAGPRIPTTLSASGADGLRALSEALLLDQRPPAAALQRPGCADRHRGPPLDRASRQRAGPSPRARRRDRPDPRGAGRGSGPGGAPASGLPRFALRRRDARCSPSARSCSASAGSRSVGGSTRSTASPKARGRSSTGRPGAARPTRSSWSSTAWPASRSGTSGPTS